MIQPAVINPIPFPDGLHAGWFAAAETRRCGKQPRQTDCILPRTANRTVALRDDERQQGQSVRVDTLDLEPHTGPAI